MRKNHRRHPGVKGRRPDNKQLRRDEAVVRQANYADLPIELKIELVERRVLAGRGNCTKELTRLRALVGSSRDGQGQKKGSKFVTKKKK